MCPLAQDLHTMDLAASFLVCLQGLSMSAVPSGGVWIGGTDARAAYMVSCMTADMVPHNDE